MTWRNLIRQPVRTSLTALGVAVGVVAIVAFTSVARGLWAATDASIHHNDGDLMIFQAGVAADIFSVLDQAKTREALLADPDVVKADAWLMHVVPAEGTPFVILFGADRGSIQDNRHRVIRGRTIESDDEVLLGTIIARNLKKDVGDALTIRGETFRVVGVFQADVVFYNGSVVATMPTVQRLVNQPGKVTSFHLWVRDGVDPRAVAARIEGRNPDLVAIAGAEEYNKVDQGLEMTNSMVYAVVFLAMVIGSVVVANTMWMSVHERTREIGILRACGWSRSSIRRLILIESIGIALIACAIGCLLGVALAELTTMLPTVNLFLEPVYDATPFAVALATGIVLSVLGGSLPAWRAARISPAEALRHE